MKRFNTLATLTATAAIAVGCGDNPKNNTYEPIRIPEGTIDLGEGTVNYGRGSYDAHSFVVISQDAGKISCGAITEDGDRHPSERRFTPAGDGNTQVDCIYPDQDNFFLSDAAIDMLREMPVETIAEK